MLMQYPQKALENIQLEGKVNQKRPERNTREEELDDGKQRDWRKLYRDVTFK